MIKDGHEGAKKSSPESLVLHEVLLLHNPTAVNSLSHPSLVISFIGWAGCNVIKNAGYGMVVDNVSVSSEMVSLSQSLSLVQKRKSDKFWSAKQEGKFSGGI